MQLLSLPRPTFAPGDGARNQRREEVRSQINDKWERKRMIPAEDKVIRDEGL